MIFRIFIVSVFMVFAGEVQAEEKPILKSKEDKLSYSIGLDVGANMKARDINVEMEPFTRGVMDGISGKKPLLTEDETKAVLAQFQKKMKEKAESQVKEVAEKNKKEGEAFLSNNKKEKGVITLESGLQYMVMTEGKGKTPKASDTVKTHYKGTLVDGTVFDSSYERGEPVSFPVGGVIRGWTEALQLMKEGSKWKLFVPSDLAYGERGAGQKIGPHAALIFEVELLSIEK